jgi:breast cancer 2 susceptibility protein
VLVRSYQSTTIPVRVTFTRVSYFKLTEITRYERELNRGVRPPLRLIANQDSPASSPMVLCVSKVTWIEGGVADDGTILPPFPELEVTDGWYRLRAKVDEPLARAIRRKVIRVGRKIAVVGARVCTPT